MTFRQLMRNYRDLISFWWIALLFGCIYIISQATIGITLHHVGAENIAKLQVTGFTADYYRETFAEWERTGAMPFYKAHFVFDGIHWLWYSISLSAFLGLAMNANDVHRKHDWMLVLPLVGGLCDCFENSVQQIFLTDPGFLTVVDPLPLFSTIASITKWTVVAIVITAIVTLSLRATFRRAPV